MNFRTNKSVVKSLLWITVLMILVFGWTSCFRRYKMNETDVEKYYRVRNYKPIFNAYKHQGRTVHYAKVGADTLPLLLLIHGAPGAWYGYIHFLDDSLLRKHFHIVSVDRPGYGKSDYGKPVTSIQKQAELIQPIIEKYGRNRKVIILGRSFGAPVAAWLASMNNERVKALFLLGADLDPDKERFWWFSGLGKSPIVRLFLPKAMNVATDEKYTRVKELKKMDSVWEKIKTYVTIMHGADDWIVDTANVNYAKRKLKNAYLRTMILPNTGHLVSNERSDLVKRELLSLVKETIEDAM